jgi:apoptosis-inducing factor 3
MRMHESKGIKFHMNAFVESAEPSSSNSSRVGSIKLKGGTVLPADVVIMAVGVGPATEFLRESGFKLEKDGAVKVDKYLRVKGIDDVYATGATLIFRTDIRRHCIVPICSTRR